MAIVSAASKVTAVVEHITAVKEGQYGEYQSVLFKRCDLTGDDAKVWKSLTPDEAALFRKGQQVRLMPAERKGKATWDIELIELTTNTPTAAPPAQSSQPKASGYQGMSKAQKQDVAAYVGEMGALYRFCLETASEQLSELDADAEAIRCCATTLFISAQRKFDLA